MKKKTRKARKTPAKPKKTTGQRLAHLIYSAGAKELGLRS